MIIKFLNVLLVTVNAFIIFAAVRNKLHRLNDSEVTVLAATVIVQIGLSLTVALLGLFG